MTKIKLPKNEVKMLYAWWTYTSSLAQAVRQGTPDSQRLADQSLHKFGKLCEKLGEDARFGSLIGMLGVGTSLYEPRFRLAARTLDLYIELRKNTAASARSKYVLYDWTGVLVAAGTPPPSVNESKEQDKLTREFSELASSKNYTKLADAVPLLLQLAMDRSRLTLTNGHVMVFEVVRILYPELPWPDAWNPRARPERPADRPSAEAVSAHLAASVAH